MARFRWQEQKIISVETRDNHFVLAQLLKSPYIAFFRVFRAQDDWTDIQAKDWELLFCVGVTAQFLQHSNIRKHNDVEPHRHLPLPEYWIDLDAAIDRFTVFAGTPDEKTILWFGKQGGSLIRRDITLGGAQNRQVVQRSIDFADRGTIEQYELTNLEVYPLLNERLALCRRLGRNVNPMKELSFGYEIPLEYRGYFESITAAKV
jgi:hypothetical protein